MNDTVLDQGIVERLENDVAVIQVNANEACEKCGARLVCAPDKNGQNKVKVYNNLHAVVGDKVQISEKGNLLLKISFLQYGLPLLGFVLGILIPHALSTDFNAVRSEVVYFMGGITGLFITFFISQKIASLMASNKENYLYISKIFP